MANEQAEAVDFCIGFSPNCCACTGGGSKSGAVNRAFTKSCCMYVRKQ